MVEHGCAIENNLKKNDRKGGWSENEYGGHLEYHGQVDLEHIAHEVVVDMEAQIMETGAHVEIGALGTVKADPHQMRQLLQNLFGNALRFHGDKRPLIKVHGRKAVPPNKKTGKYRKEWYGILVEDNGIGFDEKYLIRIFGPFQRLYSQLEYEGMGMGLAICRKIVERHGGTITAKSIPGKGSTFITILPLHPATRKE
jgi:light-regulated signal transduction histidine kinase (bacteriophytochrome)